MSRSRRGRPVHGWLVIDKPSGMTSTAVVNKVKWLLDARKAGHGGTLDPMATGLLPVAFGEATKTVNHVMAGTKAYRFTIRWGSQTNTDDAEGVRGLFMGIAGGMRRLRASTRHVHMIAAPDRTGITERRLKRSVAGDVLSLRHLAPP